MQKNNRVLIVIPSLTLGGAEKQALEYAKALRRIQKEPYILGIGREGELKELLEKEGFFYGSYSFSEFFNVNKFKQLFFLIRFVLFIRTLKVDKVISFTYWPNVIFKLIHKFCGIKKMYWNQRSVDDNIIPVFWERLGNNFKVGYIANSKASAISILKRHKLKDGDIKIIYNVMEISEKVTFDKNKNEIHLVMIANFFLEKDHFTVLKAFKKLSKSQLNKQIYIHLVGTSPGGSKRLLEVKAMAFDLGLCNKVIFHGVVSDIKNFLKKMDIGILSTFSEGFSNSIMEYMDAGLPVVATNILANLEVVTEQNSNYLFEIENVDSLAEMITIFINNYDLMKKVGERNKELALLNFSPRKLDKSLSSCFNKNT